MKKTVGIKIVQILMVSQAALYGASAMAEPLNETYVDGMASGGEHGGGGGGAQAAGGYKVASQPTPPSPRKPHRKEIKFETNAESGYMSESVVLHPKPLLLSIACKAFRMRYFVYSAIQAVLRLSFVYI